MLCYCKRCGRVVQRLSKELNKPCDYCQYSLCPVPNAYTIGGHGNVISKDLKEQFLNEYIKSSPEFDPYLFEHRDEILAQKSAKYDAAMAHGKAVLEGRDKGNKFGIECPYCHATNVKKITAASKVAHTAVFGIFSMARNGKQWHCEHCNSDF